MCTPFPDFRARAVPDPASCCFSSPPLRRCRAWFRIPRFVTVQRLRKTERWPSGRRRTPGKCVYGNPVSRVRIPPSPPDSSKGARLAPFVFPAPGVSGFEPSIDRDDGSTGGAKRHRNAEAARRRPGGRRPRRRNPSLSARFKQRGPSGPFCIFGLGDPACRLVAGPGSASGVYGGFGPPPARRSLASAPRGTSLLVQRSTQETRPTAATPARAAGRGFPRSEAFRGRR